MSFSNENFMELVVSALATSGDRAPGACRDSVGAALDRLCSEEFLSGSDRVQCPACKIRTDSRRRLEIRRLPELLAVLIRPIVEHEV